MRTKVSSLTRTGIFLVPSVINELHKSFYTHLLYICKAIMILPFKIIL